MYKFFAALLLLVSPVFAQNPEVEYYTNEAMGCVILQECTEDVYRITTIEDYFEIYPDEHFFTYEREVSYILSLLEQLKVEVYIAHEKYFLPDHRGLYHTKFNAMFLNKTFMEDHWSFLRTLRHEAFHVAQDCMAGSLNNSAVAIINLPEEVPLIAVSYTHLTLPTKVTV